ncbi:MAG: DUF45 domain-containing protein [Bacteroidales bacterium]|nr:DUF45 domain-containing protein [Bacteroidales bacterium]MDD4217336.1 DUF45 domain-containing protein [Bacteroidales bacterium]MDY0142051.1 DUF45 domain-containing protein [Bacteroidales bacterium]
MQKLLSVQGIGFVLVSKKSNARNLKIRIHPEKGILVTIPYRSSYNEAEKFVIKNAAWIKEKTKLLFQNVALKIFTPDSIFKTRVSEVEFEYDAHSELRGIISENKLLFKYNPLKIDFENKDVQNFIKKCIVKLLLAEASVYLLERYVYLSKKHKIALHKLTVGTASTSWGTCNTKNEIRLSCRLLLLPDHLIDYVILHEMCHINHKNHGSDFYKMLNYLSDYKSTELNKELKTYSTNIFPGNYTYQ